MQLHLGALTAAIMVGKAATLQAPPLISESALPLAAKRVLLLSPRDRASSLAAKLVAAGRILGFVASYGS